MKFFPLVLALAAAEVDESGLLQVHGGKVDLVATKVQEFAQFTSRQVTLLPKDEKDLDPHTVDKFAELLQSRLSVASQQSDPVKAALVQRSMPSTGSPVAKVIDQITSLPMKTQEALAFQARDSQKLKDMLATLPDIPEIHSLLLQVQAADNPFGSNDTENALSQKPQQGVTTEWVNGTCNDMAVTTKVRTTSTGWSTTTTHHNKCGTQTETLNGKNGYRHFHSYSHNGRGGNAKTVTQSSFGCWNHEHNHAHVFSKSGSITQSSTDSTMCNKKGRTRTHSHGHNHSYEVEHGVEQGVHSKGVKSHSSSKTKSVDDDGDSWTHSHNHKHKHKHAPGVGTESGTETNTESAINGKRRHSHTHQLNHWHDERDGGFSFDDDRSPFDSTDTETETANNTTD